MKVELPFHSVRMFIFSSYRVDPLLYYGSISLEIYPFMDCGYSGTDIPVVAEHGEQVGSMCNVHVLRVLTYYRYLIYSARKKKKACTKSFFYGFDDNT